MKPAVFPTNESLRLEALERYGIMDTESEQAYDDMTRIASQICGTPIALVSLLDEKRQWFKSRVGLDATETPRELAFCGHAILEQDVFVVENALEDQRFHDNPLVTGSPDIRFYAGTQLVTHDDFPLGTLCVIDKEPRTLSEEQLQALKALGNQVVAQLELRLQNKQLERANQVRDNLIAIISHDLRSSFNAMIGFSRALRKRADKMSITDIVNASSRIENASQAAHEMLLSVLEWSRQQLDQNESVSVETFEISALIEEIEGLLTEVLVDKKLELIVTGDAELTLTCNRVLFRSAVLNLITNSIKFSEIGASVIVEIKAIQNKITVGVEDKGKGMEQALAEKVFKGQESLSTTGTQGEKGLGVGTLLIKSFIDSVEGDIEVKTSPGHGCKVVLHIPA